MVSESSVISISSVGRAKKFKKIRVTPRDVEILNFINLFGFCTMVQIQKRFELKKCRSYELTRKLIGAGLLRHERIFHCQHGIYRLTQNGARFTDLPPLFKVPLANYQHNLSLVALYLWFLKKHPDARWVSERHLKNEKYASGLGKHGHLSDGILIFHDGKKIAVELELSVKGKDRLLKILKGYGSQFEISEVWYYCSKNIMGVVKNIVDKDEHLSFVKVYSFEEVLNDNS